MCMAQCQQGKGSTGWGMPCPWSVGSWRQCQPGAARHIKAAMVPEQLTNRHEGTRLVHVKAMHSSSR